VSDRCGKRRRKRTSRKTIVTRKKEGLVNEKAVLYKGKEMLLGGMMGVKRAGSSQRKKRTTNPSVLEREGERTGSLSTDGLRDGGKQGELL